jgi:hypothetical protein
MSAGSRKRPPPARASAVDSGPGQAGASIRSPRRSPLGRPCQQAAAGVEHPPSPGFAAPPLRAGVREQAGKEARPAALDRAPGSPAPRRAWGEERRPRPRGRGQRRADRLPSLRPQPPHPHSALESIVAADFSRQLQLSNSSVNN